MPLISRLALSLIVLKLSAGAPQELTHLSVCEAISNRSAYSGRVVEVRGIVMAGGHGIYLAPSGNCEYKLVTRGVVWPNIINLVFPNNRSPDVYAHAPFEYDRQVIDDADRRVLKMGYRAGLDTETATYEGLFVTYNDLEKRVSPGVPNAFRIGFGPVGLGAPAQLVIKTIKDVSVVKAVPEKPKPR